MSRLLFLVTAIGVVAGIFYLTNSGASAVPDYTAQTGQACTVCHLGDSSDLSDVGKAFQAIPSHRTDPSGAWFTLVPPTETPAPTGAATPTPGTLPPTGGKTDAGATTSWTLWLTVALGGALLASSVALIQRSRRD